MSTVRTALAPASVPASPFYSPGVLVQGAQQVVHVSGQVGHDAQGEPLEGVEAQTRQAVAHLHAVLAEAGMTGDDLVKLTIYLTDAADVPAFAAAAAGSLPTPPPATTMLVVAGLADPRLKVEIEAVAAR